MLPFRLKTDLVRSMPILLMALAVPMPALSQDARATPEVSATQDGLADRLGEAMRQQADQGFWGVVLVSQGGQVILHEAYGLADRKTNTPMRKDTVIDAGSLSKQVTAAAALFLEGQGKLSLSDPLGKYFPDVPADKKDITLAQLLSHTSGLYSWVLPEDFIPIPADVWRAKVFAKPLEHAPGGEFLYSNDGFTLVAMVVEKVSGKPFQAYLRETLFVPSNMRQTGWYDDAMFDAPGVSVATGYNNAKDDGAPNEWPGPYWALLGNGGILWTANDMLKWHRAIHGNLLPAEQKRKFFAAFTPVPKPATNGAKETVTHYALGWNIGRTRCGSQRIAHRGAGKSHNVDYRYYPEKDVLIYVASNRLDADYLGEELFYSERAANALAVEIEKNCG